MSTKRRYFWIDFEDLVLALTVVKLRSEGLTYTNAFKTASKHINRTAGACSSRWYRKTRYITNEILQSSYSAKPKYFEHMKISV